jgi:ATP-binding protein involved in chromosome partitioning
VIENMNAFECPSCGAGHFIFGKEGMVRFAVEKGLEYLGGVPLDISICSQSDRGVPIALAADNIYYSEIALKLLKRIEAAEVN